MISHHRSFPNAEWALPADEVDKVEKVYNAFTPADPVLQRAWLFGHEAQLVAGMPLEKWELRDKQLQDLRTEAVSEVLAVSGFEGVKRLIQQAKVSHFVGVAYVFSTNPKAAQNAVKELVADTTTPTQQFVHGIVAAGHHHYGWSWSEALLSVAKKKHWGESEIARLLLALPYERKTWDFAEGMTQTIRESYWKGVNFFVRGESIEDAVYSIDKMLEVGRASDVIERIAGSLSGIPPAKLVQVLSDATRADWATLRGNDIVMFQWGVGELLKALEADSSVDDATVALLEWQYLVVLEHSERTPIVLHRFMAAEPAFFVQVLAAIFRSASESAPKDHAPTEQERAMATQAFRLLQSWRTVPGVEADGYRTN